MDDAEYVRIRNEYHVTLRVLSLVVEQLLKATDSETLEISDEAVLRAPDLIAFRNDDKCVIELQIKR